MEQIIYIIRRSTIMPGTDGNPSVVYPAKRFLETINDNTNNQLMDTYIIWIGKFDSSNEKLGDAIYDLGNAFVNKVNSLESSIKDMNLIRTAFGAHAPAQKGRSQSKGPFKNPRSNGVTYVKPINILKRNFFLGSLGKAAMAFLEDFVVVVKERTGRIFNRVYWQNRIVFSIFKGMVTLISDSLSSFGKFSESLAINCFDVGEAGFEDVEF
ncbi:hypothetical protein P9112_006304 [Eukaryota sp. TZLM1-RC]